MHLQQSSPASASQLVLNISKSSTGNPSLTTSRKSPFNHSSTILTLLSLKQSRKWSLVNQQSMAHKSSTAQALQKQPLHSSPLLSSSLQNTLQTTRTFHQSSTRTSWKANLASSVHSLVTALAQSQAQSSASAPTPPTVNQLVASQSQETHQSAQSSQQQSCASCSHSSHLSCACSKPSLHVSWVACA